MINDKQLQQESCCSSIQKQQNLNNHPVKIEKSLEQIISKNLDVIIATDQEHRQKQGNLDNFQQLRQNLKLENKNIRHLDIQMQTINYQQKICAIQSQINNLSSQKKQINFEKQIHEWIEDQQGIDENEKKNNQSNDKQERVKVNKKQIQDYWDFWNSFYQPLLERYRRLKKQKRRNIEVKRINDQSNRKQNYQFMSTDPTQEDFLILNQKQKRQKINAQIIKQLHKKLEQNYFFIVNPIQRQNYLLPESNQNNCLVLPKNHFSFKIQSSSSNKQIIQFFVKYGQYAKRYIALNQANQSICHTQCKVIGIGSMGKVYKIPKLHSQHCLEIWQINDYDEDSFAQNYDNYRDKCSACKCNNFIQSDLENSFVNILKQYFIADMMSALQIGPHMQGNTKKTKLKNVSSSQSQFDFIIYKNCIQFQMEVCESLENASFQNKTRVQISQFNESILKKSLLQMHLLNVVHNDIKPSNIMFSPTFKKPVFIDFGISQQLANPIGYKTYTSFLGTILYSGTAMKNLLDAKAKGWIHLYQNDADMFINSFQKLRRSQNLHFFYRVNQKNRITIKLYLKQIQFQLKYIIYKTQNNEQQLLMQASHLLLSLKNLRLSSNIQSNQIQTSIQQLIDFLQNQYQSHLGLKEIIKYLQIIKIDKLTLQIDSQVKKQTIFQQKINRRITLNNSGNTGNKFNQNSTTQINKSAISINYLSLIKIQEFTILNQKYLKEQQIHQTHQKVKKQLQKLKNSFDKIENLKQFSLLQDINLFLKFIYFHVSIYKVYSKSTVQQKNQIAKNFLQYISLIKLKFKNNFKSQKKMNQNNQANQEKKYDEIQYILDKIQSSQFQNLVQMPEQLHILSYPQLLLLDKFLLIYCYQFPNSNFAYESAFNLLKDCILLGFIYLSFIQQFLKKIFNQLLVKKEQFFVTLAAIETIEISQIIQQKWLVVSKRHELSYKNKIFNEKFYQILSNKNKQKDKHNSFKLNKIKIFEQMWIFYNQYLSNIRKKQISVIKIYQNLIKQIEREFRGFPQYIFLISKAIQYGLFISKIFYPSVKFPNSIHSKLANKFGNFQNQSMDSFDFLIVKIQSKVSFEHIKNSISKIDQKINIEEVSKYLFVDHRLNIAIQKKGHSLIKKIISQLILNQDFNQSLSCCLFNFQHFSESIIHYISIGHSFQTLQFDKYTTHLKLIDIFYQFILIYSSQRYEEQFYITSLNLLFQILLCPTNFQTKLSKKISKIQKLVLENAKNEQQILKNKIPIQQHNNFLIQKQFNRFQNKKYLVIISYLELFRTKQKNSFQYISTMRLLLEKYPKFFFIQSDKLKYYKNIENPDRLQSQCYESQNSYSYLSTINQFLHTNLLGIILDSLNSYSLIKKYFEIKKKFYFQFKDLCSHKNLNYINTKEFDIFKTCFFQNEQIGLFLQMLIFFLSQEKNHPVNNFSQHLLLQKIMRQIIISNQVDIILFCDIFFLFIEDSNSTSFQYKKFMILINLTAVQEYFQRDLVKWKSSLLKLCSYLAQNKQNIDKRIYIDAQQYLIYQNLLLNKKLNSSAKKINNLIKKLMYKLVNQSHFFRKNSKHYVKQFLDQDSNYQSIFKKKLLTKKCNVLNIVLEFDQYLYFDKLFKKEKQNIINQSIIEQRLKIKKEQTTMDPINSLNNQIQQFLSNRPLLKNRILRQMMMKFDINNADNIFNEDICIYYRLMNSQNSFSKSQISKNKQVEVIRQRNQHFKQLEKSYEQLFEQQQKVRQRIINRQMFKEKQNIFNEINELLGLILDNGLILNNERKTNNR